MINIAICDDNPDYARTEYKLIKEALEKEIAKYEIELFFDPHTMLSSQRKYEIIFLDVEMDGMSGIEAADKIHERNQDTLIFFVTNHAGYMDEALNKHAFRFWIKPINPQRLQYGIESAIKEIRNRGVFLDVMTGKKLTRIYMKDIIFAYAKNKATTILTADGELEIREPFKNISERMTPDYFCRSHASYIVNLNYVVRYTYSEVICRCGDKLYTAYMSKRKYKDFSGCFMKWMGENI